MADAPQNYANHRRNDYVYIAGAGLVLAGTLGAAVQFFRGLDLISFAHLAFCIGVCCGYARLRPYSLTVQDRVIMLETRLRLERVLPESLKGRIPDLTRRHLIGLRFASDAELPELVERVFKENLEKADDIKKLIKNWQADYQRI